MKQNANTMKILHDQHKGIIETPNQKNRIEYKKIQPTVIEIHTADITPSASENGIDEILAEHMLKWAAEHEYFIVPSSVFIHDYIHDHPKYKDLLAPKAMVPDKFAIHVQS